MYTDKIRPGTILEIDYMDGEPQMTHRRGEFHFIDDAGQLHGSWGWLAIQPEHDQFHIVTDKE